MTPKYVIISASIFTDLETGNRNIVVHGYGETEYVAVEKAKEIAHTATTVKQYYVIQHCRTIEVKFEPVIEQEWQLDDVHIPNTSTSEDIVL